MTRALHLSDALTLPLELVTESVGILAVKRAGGSYGANLGWLRTMGLITERGPITVTEGLYR
jgi:hypothetical protein